MSALNTRVDMGGCEIDKVDEYWRYRVLGDPLRLGRKQNTENREGPISIFAQDTGK